jgi:N-methylhydantoinase A/oxoprolinase/acetone carboxylase beta subunit
MTLDSAGNNAIHTLNSGPAGGVVAAHSLASQLGLKNVLTIDIGGTTTDIAAIIDDNIQYTTSFEIEYGMPIQIPMVDVKAIGTGGGSIAWIDKGGVLQVGPQSMGADPGPICYGRGNTASVTVTDAYLCLGYLNPQKIYGGRLQLKTDCLKTSFCWRVINDHRLPPAPFDCCSLKAITPFQLLSFISCPDFRSLPRPKSIVFPCIPTRPLQSACCTSQAN